MREPPTTVSPKRKFVVTTDPRSPLAGVPPTRPVDDLTHGSWLADITYIRLNSSAMAVTLDAYSRRVGWELDLDEPPPPCAWRWHGERSCAGGDHSDRGVQYASTVRHRPAPGPRYSDQHVAAKPTRWDNAACESFMKTLKVPRRSTASSTATGHAPVPHPRVSGNDIQPKRLHSALGDSPPPSSSAACREKQNLTRRAATFFMSFLRHREIYPPMRARPLRTAPPTHRLDEFPTGLFLGGFVHQSPPPLHHGAILQQSNLAVQ